MRALGLQLSGTCGVTFISGGPLSGGPLASLGLHLSGICAVICIRVNSEEQDEQQEEPHEGERSTKRTSSKRRSKRTSSKRTSSKRMRRRRSGRRRRKSNKPKLGNGDKRNKKFEVPFDLAKPPKLCEKAKHCLHSLCSSEGGNLRLKMVGMRNTIGGW